LKNLLTYTFFALLLLGCTDTERDNPNDPRAINYNGGESSSSSVPSSSQSSSSAMPEYAYCVFVSDRICLVGPMNSCSSGGTLSNSCPYGSSSSVVISSSSTPSSSSSSVIVYSSSSAVVSSSSLEMVPSSSSATPVVSSCTLNGGTVKIGNQVWMKENLNCDVNGSKCYENNESNCVTYGRLYDWETAKKVCPSGWHLPSNAEWDALMTAVGDSLVAGRKLKATSSWSYCGPVGSGSSYVCEDAFGFSALPGGFGLSDGSFGSVGSYGIWWSASEDSSDIAYTRNMNYNDEYAYWFYNDKDCLFSVRCLQD